MKKKNFTHNKDKAELKNIHFCAECGEELEYFGIDKVDLGKVKERYHNCKAKGKFKGDKCAMIFIAEDNENINLPDEEE